MNDRSRLRLDIAVARALLDEVERQEMPDGHVVAQLIEELSRVAEDLARASQPPSGVQLRASA